VGGVQHEHAAVGAHRRSHHGAILARSCHLGTPRPGPP
jgi:hypothetical protein